jgi:hypothetical protein
MLLLLHQYPLAPPYQTHARAVLLALPLHPLLLQSLPWLLLLALCVATAACQRPRLPPHRAHQQHQQRCQFS